MFFEDILLLTTPWYITEFPAGIRVLSVTPRSLTAVCVSAVVLVLVQEIIFVDVGRLGVPSLTREARLSVAYRSRVVPTVMGECTLRGNYQNISNSLNNTVNTRCKPRRAVLQDEAIEINVPLQE